MALQIKVRDRAQREDHIKYLSANSDLTDTVHGYQGKSITVPKIRIASDYLVYRMANFRTQTAQLRWLRQNSEKRKDYFSLGEENASAQQAQHVLLLGLAKKGTQSITPIYEVLKKDPTQLEPLLITASGVVVNGNRRLAAMRQLSADEESAIYSSFSHVDCVVLPSTALPRDLEEIEVQLQMARETKLPYGWIDQALAVKKLLADGLPKSRVVELMHLDEDADVQSIITQLNEVELYLAEYKESAADYELVDSDKQIFLELEKAIRGKSGVEQESRRLVAHVIIGNNDDVLSGRVYDYRQAFGKHHDDIVKALAETYEIADGASGDGLELEIDLPQDEGAPTLTGLRELLKDKKRGADLAKTIAETLDSLIADKTEEKSAKRSLALAQKALESLGKIDVSKTPEDLKASVVAVLEQVEREAMRLVADLSKGSQ